MQLVEGAPAYNSASCGNSSWVYVEGVAMLLVIAFVSLGFLIGNLAGLTSASITVPLLSALFAFGGGSAVAWLQKIDTESRHLASVIIFSLSLSCLIGVYSGIYVSEHQLLTPEKVRQERWADDSSLTYLYLRSVDIALAHKIDQMYTSKRITAEQAYEQIYEMFTAEISNEKSE